MEKNNNTIPYILAKKQLATQNVCKRNPMTYLVSSSCTLFPQKGVFKSPFPHITHNLVYNTKVDCFPSLACTSSGSLCSQITSKLK